MSLKQKDGPAVRTWVSTCGLPELSVPVAEQQVQRWGRCITHEGLSSCTGTGGGGSSRVVEETMEISACAVPLSLFSQSLARVCMYLFSWRT